MKVNNVSHVYGVYETQPVSGRTPVKTAQAHEKDKLMLSRDAISFQTVMKGLKDAPAIRADKVAELSAIYDSGERIADTKDVAEALYRSGALNRP